MDFKSILNKLDSMEAPPKGVPAPELPKAVQLDESAQLRVLAGRSTILAESALMEKAMSQAQQQAAGAALAAKRGDAPKSGLKGASKEMLSMSTKELEKIAGTKHKGLPKKKTEESVKEDMKVGDTKKTATGELTKTKSGVVHKRTDYKDDEHGEAPSTVKQKSAAEKKADKEKDIKLPKHKGKTWGMKGGEKFGTKESVEEAAKPDFLDVDGDGDKTEPMKKAAAEKGGDKKDGKKGMTAKQAKYFGKKNESVKSSKEVISESTLTFAKALQIIKESNGTAQIDPLDGDLWKWARRVAESKFTESVKIDVYAATTYERMGGTWSIVQINE